MDIFIIDWFLGFDVIMVYGYCLVIRIILCFKCIMVVCGVESEKKLKERENVVIDVLILFFGVDSGINLLMIDGSSISVLLWLSFVYVLRKFGVNGEGILVVF